MDKNQLSCWKLKTNKEGSYGKTNQNLLNIRVHPPRNLLPGEFPIPRGKYFCPGEDAPYSTSWHCNTMSNLTIFFFRFFGHQMAEKIGSTAFWDLDTLSRIRYSNSQKTSKVKSTLHYSST